MHYLISSLSFVWHITIPWGLHKKDLPLKLVLLFPLILKRYIILPYDSSKSKSRCWSEYICPRISWFQWFSNERYTTLSNGWNSSVVFDGKQNSLISSWSTASTVRDSLSKQSLTMNLFIFWALPRFIRWALCLDNCGFVVKKTVKPVFSSFFFGDKKTMLNILSTEFKCWTSH